MENQAVLCPYSAQNGKKCCLVTTSERKSKSPPSGGRKKHTKVADLNHGKPTNLLMIFNILPNTKMRQLPLLLVAPLLTSCDLLDPPYKPTPYTSQRHLPTYDPPDPSTGSTQLRTDDKPDNSPSSEPPSAPDPKPSSHADAELKARIAQQRIDLAAIQQRINGKMAINNGLDGELESSKNEIARLEEEKRQKIAIISRLEADLERTNEAFRNAKQKADSL